MHTNNKVTIKMLNTVTFWYLWRICADLFAHNRCDLTCASMHIGIGPDCNISTSCTAFLSALEVWGFFRAACFRKGALEAVIGSRNKTVLHGPGLKHSQNISTQCHVHLAFKASNGILQLSCTTFPATQLLLYMEPLSNYLTWQVSREGSKFSKVNG